MDYEAYLHEKGLKTFDPYGQSNLLPFERQSPDRDSLEILNRYTVEVEKIFCHICGSKRHNNGFTGVISDGSAILFGSVCAKDYFCEEVLRHAELTFTTQEDVAFAEFSVKKLKSTASEMERWLQRYKKLINNIAEKWDVILTDHKDTFEEIFSHLEKNNSRLTEEFVEEASEVSRMVGRSDQVVSRKVVCAVRNFTPLKAVRDFRNHHRIVSALPRVLLAMDDATPRATILELDEKLRSNFFRSLDELERVIRLSVELFTDPTFSQVCLWSDRQRILRLRQTDSITPRNFSRTLRKKLGDGYELPRPMLRDIVATETFLTGEQNSDRVVGTKNTRAR